MMEHIRALYVPLTFLLLAAACTDNGPSAAESSSSTRSAESATPGLVALPTREGPRRETTNGVPHVQLDAVPVPEVDAELRRRVALLPGVEDPESELGFADTQSLWLADDIDIVRPEILLSGREFAHIHSNGSLHVWLPVDRAFEVATTGWGELHPWVGRADFWDGMSMVYTPESLDDVDVTMLLVVDAYNLVTGENLDSDDFR